MGRLLSYSLVIEFMVHRAVQARHYEQTCSFDGCGLIVFIRYGIKAIFHQISIFGEILMYTFSHLLRCPLSKKSSEGTGTSVQND